MEAAATALTTLPLSTKILTTESAIFVKVEKMEVRIGSSNPCAWGEAGSGSPEEVFWGLATAIVCSRGVNGLVSLMMHPINPGCPSKPAVRSGSASYTSVTGSMTSGGVCARHHRGSRRGGLAQDERLAAETDIGTRSGPILGT